MTLGLKVQNNKDDPRTQGFRTIRMTLGLKVQNNKDDPRTQGSEQ